MAGRERPAAEYSTGPAASGSVVSRSVRVRRRLRTGPPAGPGRRSRVRSRACSRAPAPDRAVVAGVRIAGTSMPAELGGRVYCGYSSRPARTTPPPSTRRRWRPGSSRMHRVDDDQRRQLAAGEHVVADRELEVDERADALVDALVAGADEDAVRPRRRDPAARAWRKTSPAGSSRIDARFRPAQLRRARRRPAPGRRTIPAPPPYGASSTLRCRPRPHVAQVVDPDLGQAPLLDPARDALGRAGPSNIAGNSVTTSISSVMAAAVRRRRPRLRRRRPRRRPRSPSAVSAVAVVAGRRLRRRGAFGRSGSGVVGFAGRRSSAAASTTISPRRGAKTRMNARTAGRSNAPTVPPPTTQHLGLADAIDVARRSRARRRPMPRTATPTTSCQ